MSRIDEKAAELREQLAPTEIDPALEASMAGTDLKVMQYGLADAIREGAGVSDQAYDWGTGDTACALTAAVIAAKARGYV